MNADRDNLTLGELRRLIGEHLGFQVPEATVDFTVTDVVVEDGYTRRRIRYTGEEGDLIDAFLLVPEGSGPFPAVLAHHQHHGQRHLGKSEV